MKVAIVVPIIGNFGKKGFYHSQEIGLGKTIASHGNDVTVYKCVPVKSMEAVYDELHGDVRVKYIPTRALGVHGMLNVELIDKDSDVAFTFSDTQLIIPKLNQYCKKNDIKFIPYIGIAHSFQRNLKSKLFDFVFKYTTLKVYKRETVVAKTIDAKKELEALGVKDCVVAPVGMDFEALKQDYEKYDRIQIREKWGFEEQDMIISFVGRMKPEKHPFEVQEIFAEIEKKNKKLLMVGKGFLEEKIHQKARKLGIEDKMVFIPEVKYEDMWQIHYISDYFINACTDEIFGMAIMEAIYYKSCVIALRAPGPNTILDGMEGHFLCDNYKDIINAVNGNQIDHDVLEQSANKLKEYISWELCYKQIKKIAGK